MKFDSKLFCTRLKEITGAKTSRELARILGVVPTTITAWQNGRNCPQLKMIFYLAGKYGVSPQYLMGLSDRMSDDDTISRKALMDALDASMKEHVRRQEESQRMESAFDLGEFAGMALAMGLIRNFKEE